MSDTLSLASLDYALSLWRIGLSVIPVPRPVPGAPKGTPGDGKVPAIPWKAYQTTRATEAEVRRWFATEQNVAVICGAVSNVVVVDADSPDAERWVRANLRRTPWRVRTPRGLHLYYRYPGVPVGNRARIVTPGGALALDVRGDGGYVIGPGSVHASGATYQAQGDWSVPSSSLPAFWVGLLERTRRVGTTSSPAGRQHLTTHASVTPIGDAATRARAYLRAIPRPVIGQGSDNATFYAACRVVRGFGLEPEAATDLLLEWSGFDREWIARKVESALKYGEEAPGALLEARQ